MHAIDRAPHAVPAPPDRHAIVRSLAGLRRIDEPALNLALVRRPAPLFVEWLAARAHALPEHGGGARKASVTLAEPDLGPLLAPLSPCPERDALEADLRSLVAAFAIASGARAASAEIARVTTDSCRKLHVDWVRLRLITTYVGPATEWAAERHVDRAALERLEPSVARANRLVLRRGGRLRHAAAGDVILLKGEAFLGNGGKGAVHRSPPIEHAGLTRVVFTLTVSRAPGDSTSFCDRNEETT